MRKSITQAFVVRVSTGEVDILDKTRGLKGEVWIRTHNDSAKKFARSEWEAVKINRMADDKPTYVILLESGKIINIESNDFELWLDEIYNS